MCGKAPAVVKVGEEIAHDDPNPHRHNATAYLCRECEGIVLHGAWLRAPQVAATSGEAVAWMVEIEDQGQWYPDVARILEGDAKFAARCWRENAGRNARVYPLYRAAPLPAAPTEPTP
jgi:hypothetical protein